MLPDKPSPFSLLTQGHPDRGSNFFEHVASLIAGVVYAITFRQVYWSYISVEWEFTGLIYRELGFFELAFIYVAIAIVSWFMPYRIDRPSVMIVWFLYAIVYVPTMAITMMIGLLPGVSYGPVLAAFSVGFILICRVTAQKEANTGDSSFRPGKTFVSTLVAIFLGMTAIIFVIFRDIMSFASIDDVYVQRFAAADMTGGASGYLRAYYGSVFAPLLIAIGITDRSRWPLAALGSSGFVMAYMIDASKISLAIPLLMIAFGIAIRWRKARLYHLTAGMAVICLGSALLTSSTRLVRFIADLVLLRTISIPAQTFAQYYDIFSQKGYTWWSNVTGLNLVIPPPAAFRLDQFWPVLGQIVGAEYYGFDSRVNLNANPFVGEGAAAAGWFGILIISIALAVFLRMLDRLSSRWDRQLVLVLMVPIGLTLTNVHLSTFLVSFGGLAWLMLFRFYKPTSSPISVFNDCNNDPLAFANATTSLRADEQRR